MKPPKTSSILPAHDTERAVSPVVGVALIIGIVVLGGIALQVLGFGIISDTEDPQIESQYSAEITSVGNQINATIFYTDGDEINNQNTHKIDILITSHPNPAVSSGTRITVYNESGQLKPAANRSFGPGTIVLEGDDPDNILDPGTTFQVMWTPESDHDLELTVDEIAIPPEEEIADGTVISASGIDVTTNSTTGGDRHR